MDQFDSLRAEIKAWERAFQQEHGRRPTPDDAKQKPGMAAKYKLYKKLGKNAASKGDSQSQPLPVLPSTPPRRTPGMESPSKLLVRTSTVEPTAPLSSFNPFSPQKKAQQKDKHRISNIFGSPIKRPLFAIATTTSPGATSLFRPSSSTPPPTSPPPEPSTAVSRARKRLRGDPVSPSPQKDKRRRVTQQTSISSSRSRLQTPSSDEDSDDQAGESSFIDNSPVKPTNGRSFSVLFDERPLPVANLFGTAPVDGASSQKSKDRKVPKLKNAPIQTKLPFKRPVSIESTSREGSSAPLSPVPSATSSGAPSLSASRSSQKRPWSEDDEPSPMDEDAPRPKSPLLPPSPPPNPQSQYARAKAKSKGKMAAARKKARTDDQEDDSSDESEQPPKLKITNRFKTRVPRAEGLDDEGIEAGLDPSFGYARFTTPHVPATEEDDSTQDDAALTADLPDKLRDLLALPSSKTRNRDVDLRVKGLLYGRRVTHYDPTKGGEIWDVGENEELIDGGHNHTEGEDDWEGEPIPWEVGEL